MTRNSVERKCLASKVLTWRQDERSAARMYDIREIVDLCPSLACCQVANARRVPQPYSRRALLAWSLDLRPVLPVGKIAWP